MSAPRAARAAKQSEERVSIQSSGLLAETVYDPATNALQFAVCQNGAVSLHKELSLNARCFTPPHAFTRIIANGLVVSMPTGVSKYGAQEQLLSDLKNFIHRYLDVPAFTEDLIAHYILLSWVYDRFTAVPYLRFIGEFGTGKSRILQVCGQLCFKGIMAGGATTSSPMFRLMDSFHGTLIVDEADYKSSDSWSDVIKILNCGYMYGNPVLRSEKEGDSYVPRPYDVFGPKVIANRNRFADQALESRCITIQMQDRSVRLDVPRQLPKRFYSEAAELRNKLLQWRFDGFEHIHSDESKLLHLDSRLAQIGTALYSVSADEKFKAQLIDYLSAYGDELRAERPQNAIVAALVELAKGSSGAVPLTVKNVTDTANRLSSGYEQRFSSKQVGGLLRALGLQTRRAAHGYQFTVSRGKLDELVRKYPQG